MPARILDAVPGLVREFAEVDFPRVRREPQHEDVGPGTEDPFAPARDDDAADLGMLEANALQRIGELDIDAKVVRVELQLVAWLETPILVDAKCERRHRPVERQLPVRVAIRMGVVDDPAFVLHCAIACERGRCGCHVYSSCPTPKRLRATCAGSVRGVRPWCRASRLLSCTAARALREFSSGLPSPRRDPAS